MHIEIICTGDEVLTGKTINTNFSHISQKLEDVGLAVRWGTTVGDDRETLLQAFRIAGERAMPSSSTAGSALPSTTSHKRWRPRRRASTWCYMRVG